MDIFTTQLRRVVPVRIKPEKLKVKALVKDVGVGKLHEEQDHSLKDEVDVYIHNQQEQHAQNDEHNVDETTKEETLDSQEKTKKVKGNRLDIFV